MAALVKFVYLYNARFESLECRNKILGYIFLSRLSTYAHMAFHTPNLLSKHSSRDYPKRDTPRNKQFQRQNLCPTESNMISDYKL